MIKAKDAIATARSLLGTPYATMDCIGLIRAVIKRSPGGVSDYRCEGTNWLWDSINNSGKYRHLTWRQESLDGAKAGMVCFKRYDPGKEDHVGLVTGEGTVIHSSSVYEKVVETPLTTGEGWSLLGIHRYIEPGETAPAEVINMVSYTARVDVGAEDEKLNVRNEPSMSGQIIGRIGHGAKVTVRANASADWRYITYGDNGLGYVRAEYLVECEPDPVVTDIPVVDKITIIDSEGNRFEPKGDFRVLIGSID